MADADRPGDKRLGRLQRQQHGVRPATFGLEAQRPNGSDSPAWSLTTPGSGCAAVTAHPATFGGDNIPAKFLRASHPAHQLQTFRDTYAADGGFPTGCLTSRPTGTHFSWPCSERAAGRHEGRHSACAQRRDTPGRPLACAGRLSQQASIGSSATAARCCRCGTSALGRTSGEVGVVTPSPAPLVPLTSTRNWLRRGGSRIHSPRLSARKSRFSRQFLKRIDQLAEVSVQVGIAGCRSTPPPRPRAFRSGDDILMAPLAAAPSTKLACSRQQPSQLSTLPPAR